MDEETANSLRSDVTLYLGTRVRGQWYTPSQLYDALGVAHRSPPLPPEEFSRFLHELAGRKILSRWRSAGGSAELFGPL